MALLGLDVEFPAGIDQVDVLEGNTAIEERVLENGHSLGEGLAVVGGALDVITLVDLHCPVEHVADHHEVDLPARTLVLHLVQSVYAHEEGLGITADVLHVVRQDLP
jgi:hypothetical protein